MHTIKLNGSLGDHPHCLNTRLRQSESNKKLRHAEDLEKRVFDDIVERNGYFVKVFHTRLRKPVSLTNNCDLRSLPQSHHNSGRKIAQPRPHTTGYVAVYLHRLLVNFPVCLCSAGCQTDSN